jgi:hypothetical protein
MPSNEVPSYATGFGSETPAALDRAPEPYDRAMGQALHHFALLLALAAWSQNGSRFPTLEPTTATA